MRRPLDYSFAVYCFFLCLPAIAFSAAVGYFLDGHAPLIVKRERSRVTREYREIAEQLNRSPRKATYRGERQRGWRQSGRLGRTGERRRAWGVSEWEQNRMLVWVEDGSKGVRGISVPRVQETDFAGIFYYYVPAFAGALWISTTISLVFLWKSRREREDFLAATAHDLTTPLAAMRLMIGRSDDDARRLNERMIRLVDNLRDFLKLGGKRPAPIMTAFDLKSAYDEAYSLFRDDYQDIFDGADVEVICDDGVRTGVFADESRTVQILWNLLGNDLKYAAPFGRVAVRITADAGFVRMAFEDEGQGMTARQRKRAFDRYYRASTAMKSGKGGFGIGLCTAREFAREMGGELCVAANSPKGCVFTLSLPMASAGMCKGETKGAVS